MLSMDRVINKTARILVVTALTVSMIAPATVYASDEAVVDIDATDKDVEVHVEEDIHATGKNQDGVDVKADGDHTVEVTTKNIESDGSAGIFACAMNKSDVDIKVDGDVTAGKYGVFTTSFDDSNIDVNVNGGILSNESDGISIASWDGSSNTVTVDGDVKSTYSGDDLYGGYGVDVSVYGSSTPEASGVSGKSASFVHVKGDVEGTEIGAVVGSCEGFSTVVVDGSVSAGGEYEYHGRKGLSVWSQNNGVSEVFVGKDVRGDDWGLVINSSDSASSNVVIVGTLYGGEKGTILSDGKEGNSIAVWKIDTKDEDGFIASKKEGGKFVEDKETEKKIQYIVKVAPTDGATLVATDENGKALAKVDAANGKSYEYALQGDKVLLKIDVDDDYSLDAVYGDDGKQYKLGKDDKGNYYIIVPAGGGVQFSAVLSKKEKDKDDEKKDETPVSNNAQTVTIPTAAAVAQAAVQAAVQSISSTPAGGTANVAVTGTTIDASVVKSLLARSDVNVSLACFVNGKLCTIMIPAGADLSDIINPDGTIDIEKLAKKFGKTEVQ